MSSPKYTRRHYVDIADTLTHIVDKRERASQAMVWCEKFSCDNARFKRDRFLAACGVESE
jgi:hypothetical protein